MGIYFFNKKNKKSEKQMNILFIETHLSPHNGGIERVSYRLGSYFSSQGIECYYLFWNNDSDVIDIEHKVYLGNTKLTFFQYRKILFNCIKKWKINIIINQQIFSDSLWFILNEIKKRRLCKIITCLHQPPNVYQYIPSLPMSKRYILYKFTRLFPITFTDRVRKYCDLSDCFVLLSNSFIEDFKKIYKPKFESHLIAIPNPCTFDSCISIDELSLKKNQVLIVSRFWEKQKNICAALRIWKQIEKMMQLNWELIIAGNGQDEETIRQYALSIGLKRCRFIGAVSNPLSLYKTSKIFLMTSHFEGFGMTLIEALQNGCVPVVFDTFNAVHDIIKDGSNGFIIPPYDENLFASKVILLMNNEKMWLKIAQQAIGSVSSFQLDVIGQHWLKILTRL